MGVKIKYDECPKVLNDFLDYLLNVKFYSEHTVSAYCLDLLCFFGFLRDYLGLGVPIKRFTVFVLLAVKEADVIAFLVYLNFYRNNTASTRQRRLSCIRSFYRWLICKLPNWGVKSPAESMPSVRRMSGLPKCLSLEQAREMKHVFTVCNSLYPRRDNMIVSLFLCTGMRLSELSEIDLRDVDLVDGCIRICGEGNKERVVWLSGAVVKELEEYLKWRNGLGLEGALFVGHRGERLGGSGIERVCRKAFEWMGCCGFTTHSLRHTAATILYEYTGCDVLVLKEFLGHGSLEATKVYTHVCDSDLRKAVECNPLSDFLG